MVKVLIVHNRYQQRGGEDSVFENESLLLREKGNDVYEYVEDNKRVHSLSKLAIASRTFWSMESYRKLRQVIRQYKPDIAHFHNTFFMISPAAYYACHAEGIPVVQTVHNYRLLCPSAVLYRDGHICEDCLGKKVKIPGVIHGCYHNSKTQSAVVAGMLAFHHLLGTWQNQVDMYIALTEFGKMKMIEEGFPAQKIFVKTNFILADPGAHEEQSGFALFIGRLTAEKGVNTLLQAWQGLKIPLKIAGDGPLTSQVHQAASPYIRSLGAVRYNEILSASKQANFLVFPSEWFEGCPSVIMEAFACGVPIIASRHGSMFELIKDNFSGLFFTPSDAIDLAEKVRWAWEHPAEMAEMGRNARREYEAKYTAEKNYGLLMEIYSRAIAENKAVK